jgi:hypothetical protein
MASVGSGAPLPVRSNGLGALLPGPPQSQVCVDQARRPRSVVAGRYGGLLAPLAALGFWYRSDRNDPSRERTSDPRIAGGAILCTFELVSAVCVQIPTLHAVHVYRRKRIRQPRPTSSDAPVSQPPRAQLYDGVPGRQSRRGGGRQQCELSARDHVLVHRFRRRRAGARAETHCQGSCEDDTPHA